MLKTALKRVRESSRKDIRLFALLALFFLFGRKKARLTTSLFRSWISKYVTYLSLASSRNLANLRDR